MVCKFKIEEVRVEIKIIAYFCATTTTINTIVDTYYFFIFCHAIIYNVLHILFNGGPFLRTKLECLKPFDLKNYLA